MRMSRIPQELSVYTSLGYTRLDNHSFKKNLFKTNFLIEKFQILIFLWLFTVIKWFISFAEYGAPELAELETKSMTLKNSLISKKWNKQIVT